MHTTETKNGTVFIHNSDLSGTVLIIAMDGQELKLPGDDLIELVERHLADRRHPDEPQGRPMSSPAAPPRK